MKLVIIIALVALGSYIGGYLYHQPETIVETDIIEKPVIVERVIEVEKIVEVPIGVVAEAKPVPRNFDSLEDLKEWLSQQEIVQRFYFDKPFNCMDYSAYLIRKAALDGYLFTQEAIVYMPEKEAHALCKTFINDEWIYVDAQTFEIVEKSW